MEAARPWPIGTRLRIHQMLWRVMAYDGERVSLKVVGEFTGRGERFIVHPDGFTDSRLVSSVRDDVLRQLRAELKRVEAKSSKLSAARAGLPAGSSRARVTTANAKWARAAEQRDRLLTQIESLEAETC